MLSRRIKHRVLHLFLCSLFSRCPSFAAFVGDMGRNLLLPGQVVLRRLSAEAEEYIAAEGLEIAGPAGRVGHGLLSVFLFFLFYNFNFFWREAVERVHQLVYLPLPRAYVRLGIPLFRQQDSVNQFRYLVLLFL